MCDDERRMDKEGDCGDRGERERERETKQEIETKKKREAYMVGGEVRGQRR